MAKKSPKLSWCKARIVNYLNWWASEMSYKVNWDYDGISLIDPKQTSHMLETLEALREYGLDDSIVEKAFIPFSIDQKLPSGEVKLVRTSDSVSDADELQLFLLPYVLCRLVSKFCSICNKAGLRSIFTVLFLNIFFNILRVTNQQIGVFHHQPF